MIEHAARRWSTVVPSDSSGEFLDATGLLPRVIDSLSLECGTLLSTSPIAPPTRRPHIWTGAPPLLFLTMFHLLQFTPRNYIFLLLFLIVRDSSDMWITYHSFTLHFFDVATDDAKENLKSLRSRWVLFKLLIPLRSSDPVWRR
jgi:hypothetical protein